VRPGSSGFFSDRIVRCRVASLDHLVLAMYFAAFVLGDPDQVLSVRRAINVG